MLMSKDAIGEVSQMIDVSDFYQPRNQTVYEAVIKLFSASQPVDAVLVANELLAEGNLEKVGGSDYLHSLVASVPTAANATYYADIVHQRAILRNVIAAGTKSHSSATPQKARRPKTSSTWRRPKYMRCPPAKCGRTTRRSAPSSPIRLTSSTVCKAAKCPEACRRASATSTM